MNKEFKAIVIKMLNELRKIIQEHCENFDKELEKILKNKYSAEEMVTNIKSILEGI